MEIEDWLDKASLSNMLDTVSDLDFGEDVDYECTDNIMRENLYFVHRFYDEKSFQKSGSDNNFL